MEHSASLDPSVLSQDGNQFRYVHASVCNHRQAAIFNLTYLLPPPPRCLNRSVLKWNSNLVSNVSFQPFFHMHMQRMCSHISQVSHRRNVNLTLELVATSLGSSRSSERNCFLLTITLAVKTATISRPLPLHPTITIFITPSVHSSS